MAAIALALCILGSPVPVSKVKSDASWQGRAHTARATAYCRHCPDGGGPTTRTGEPVGEGGVAADPHYWGPGSVVAFLVAGHWTTRTVNDTGGKIIGAYRFDLGYASHRAHRNVGGRLPMRVIRRLPPVPVSKWPTWGTPAKRRAKGRRP